MVMPRGDTHTPTGEERRRKHHGALQGTWLSASAYMPRVNRAVGQGKERALISHVLLFSLL